MLFKMNGVQELVNAEKEKRTSMNDVGTEDEKEKAKRVVTTVRRSLVLNAGRVN